MTGLAIFIQSLSFPLWGNIVEKMARLQQLRALEETNYLDSFQSDFKPEHRIEKALAIFAIDLWLNGML